MLRGEKKKLLLVRTRRNKRLIGGKAKVLLESKQKKSRMGTRTKPKNGNPTLVVDPAAIKKIEEAKPHEGKHTRRNCSHKAEQKVAFSGIDRNDALKQPSRGKRRNNSGGLNRGGGPDLKKILQTLVKPGREEVKGVDTNMPSYKTGQNDGTNYIAREKIRNC